MNYPVLSLRLVTEEVEIHSYPIPGEQRHRNLFALFIQPDSQLTLTYNPGSSFSQAHVLLHRDTCIHIIKDTVTIPRIDLIFG